MENIKLTDLEFTGIQARGLQMQSAKLAMDNFLSGLGLAHGITGNFQVDERARELVILPDAPQPA